MEKKEMIPADAFCSSRHVDISFIQLLQENGLIELITIDEKIYILPDQLLELEKFSRLHYDLDINLAGIEAINHLLNRVQDMQQSITELRNRLRFYESA
ncbi:MAG TPA: chaperone modulator CbpM [Flavitalea sp.]|nr:chaperone modulator CbpM [Flavitalea sp.]